MNFLLVGIFAFTMNANSRRISRLFNWRDYSANYNVISSYTKTATSSPPYYTETTSTTSLTYITPTRAVFTGAIGNKMEEEVLMTITDENFNFMFGYATQVAGVKYYDTQKYLVARERVVGAESKMIYVTRIPNDNEEEDIPNSYSYRS